MLRPIVSLLLLFTALLGLGYPLAMTGLAGALFPFEAGGSLILRDSDVVGSALIGQAFTSDRYFHGRPSAAGTGYDATLSGASNLGPTSAALVAAIAERTAAIRVRDGAVPVPVDLATASASGLDPDISPAAARLQTARVARARGVPRAVVEALVAAQITAPTYGILGPARVNVLRLNLALDAQAP